MRRETIYDEVYDAQENFRLLLDSMARPGKINVLPDMDILPPTGINKSSTLIALSLLNADASFISIATNNQEITTYLALNTGATVASINTADYIFLNGDQAPALIDGAKHGNLSYPEESSTLIIDVNKISISPILNAVQLILKGPGIETETVVYIDGINPHLLQAIKELNLEFPLGIDLMLTDKQNNLICIPRSNRFVYNTFN